VLLVNYVDTIIVSYLQTEKINLRNLLSNSDTGLNDSIVRQNVSKM